MLVDEVLCHGENGGATCETSHRGCFISKEVTAGGRFNFFLDSDSKPRFSFVTVRRHCKKDHWTSEETVLKDRFQDCKVLEGVGV